MAHVATRLSQQEHGLWDLPPLEALGLWQKIHDTVREQLRKLNDDQPTPTATIIDSQSMRTAEGGQERVYDATKKVT